MTTELKPVPETMGLIVTQDEAESREKTRWFVRRFIPRWLLIVIGWIVVTRMRLRYKEQRFFRRWLDIDTDVAIFSSHLLNHERQLNAYRGDLDVIRESDRALRRRYQAVCFERMDNLHTMQTSRIVAQQREIELLKQEIDRLKRISQPKHRQ